MHKKILAILVPVVLPYFAPAQDLLTLGKATEIALENNYSIRIARNDAEIAQNNHSLGNAGFLPQVELTAGRANSINDTKQTFVTGNVVDRTGATSNSTTATATLNWTIFDGFNTFASYNKLRELRSIGETNAKLAVESTLSQIIVAYYDVVRQKQLLKAIQNDIAISEDRLRKAQDKYRFGTGSKLEMLRAKVDLNADKSNMLKQEVALANAKITLNQLLARPVEIEFDVADSIDIAPKLSREALAQQALSNNSLLTIAATNRNVARMEVRAAQALWYPEIGLNVGYTFTKSESNAGFLLSNRNLGFSANISASFNLFNGFNNKRELENAGLAESNSELAYRQTRTQVEADLAKAYQNYENSLRLVALERENVEVARENVEMTLARYEVGTITSLEFREAQKNLIDTEARLISAQFDAKRWETELRRLSGEVGR
jgi:outer membrane protein TolC